MLAHCKSMTFSCDQQSAGARTEPTPFDLWLAADLRRRFGEPERLPEDWLRMIDSVHGAS